MERRMIVAVITLCFLVFAVVFFSLPGAQAANVSTLKVVGLYSETTAGTVSYRVGNGEWTAVKLGDEIPHNAEISITVDRDWVELCPANNPNAVYEIAGSTDGEVRRTMVDLLKEKPKTVSLPKAGGDLQYVNKVVVKEYLGRQRYLIGDSGWQDIKYGDVLEVGGTVNIIGINNTLLLILPDGTETKVIGPVRFTIENLLKGQNLYRYLNVH